MKNLNYSIAIVFFIFTVISCSKDEEKNKNSNVDLLVTTKPITNLTAFSAESGGDIIGSEPITDRGICWGTNATPSLDDTFVSDIDPVQGEFSLTMLVLEPNKTYYVSAYAITKSGETIYGKPLNFTTKAVEQRAESNSYLVKPGDAVVIPVKRANKSKLGNQISANDAITAELMWMDNLDVVESVFVYGVGESGSVVALTGDTEGNALVAVKVNNKIVWSWHIWVIKDAASVGTITMPSGAKLMDRNLGATSKVFGEVEAVGMQYQFGRKDPFTASSSFGAPADRLLYNLNGEFPEIVKVAGPRNLKFVTENPNTFVTTQQGGDWGDEDIRDWWKTEDGSKSVYDPSPEGWRVANMDDYAELADVHFNKDVIAGHLFIFSGQSNYFPFTGYRETGGAMDATGNYGTLWTNEAFQIGNAFSPTYGLGGTQDVNGAPRARALSIRCVKE